MNGIAKPWLFQTTLSLLFLSLNIIASEGHMPTQNPQLQHLPSSMITCFLFLSTLNTL